MNPKRPRPYKYRIPIWEDLMKKSGTKERRSGASCQLLIETVVVVVAVVVGGGGGGGGVVGVGAGAGAGAGARAGVGVPSTGK